jgi:cytochrome c5
MLTVRAVLVRRCVVCHGTAAPGAPLAAIL